MSEGSTGEFQLLMLPGTESDLHYITLVMHCHLCRKKKIKSHRLIFADSVKKRLLKHHHYWPGISIQEFKYFSSWLSFFVSGLSVGFLYLFQAMHVISKGSK